MHFKLDPRHAFQFLLSLSNSSLPCSSVAQPSVILASLWSSFPRRAGLRGGRALFSGRPTPPSPVQASANGCGLPAASAALFLVWPAGCPGCLPHCPRPPLASCVCGLNCVCRPVDTWLRWRAMVNPSFCRVSSRSCRCRSVGGSLARTYGSELTSVTNLRVSKATF